MEVVEVHVRIWNLDPAGPPAQARVMYNRLLPFINLGFCLGLRMIKEALVLRGIIATSTMRLPRAITLDAHDRRELPCILTDWEDLLDADTARNHLQCGPIVRYSYSFGFPWATFSTRLL